MLKENKNFNINQLQVQSNRKKHRLILWAWKKLYNVYHLNIEIWRKSSIKLKSKKLSSHQFYDYKIELNKNRNQLFKNRMYSISIYKLQKLKKYLNDNLKKSFINFNYTSYVSLMLFAIKSNESLRICVDYRKLNVITCRNRYFISLIEKILTKIMNCKYFIKLNVIVAFNKLRMHFDNEKLIIFIIWINAYKYHVLSFDSINESFNYQHYINNMLWKFLNDFCSIYLNDILIYNKIYKKHVKHVRCNRVLSRTRIIF